jgi:hypothetical protein
VLDAKRKNSNYAASIQPLKSISIENLPLDPVLFPTANFVGKQFFSKKNKEENCVNNYKK